MHILAVTFSFFWLCDCDSARHVDGAPVITVPISTHVGVFAVSMQRLTAQAFLFTPPTQMRAAHHRHAIKSLLHYSKLKQTPAPLRLGEWDH